MVADWLVALFFLIAGFIHPQATATGHERAVARSSAIAALSHDPPAGWSRELGLSVMAQLSWEESRFHVDAIGPARCNAAGDCHAYCAFQVEHRPELLHDPVGCALVAYAIVRAGAMSCPEHPLAPFSGGCENRAAQEIGDRRLKEARRHLGQASARY